MQTEAADTNLDRGLRALAAGAATEQSLEEIRQLVSVIRADLQAASTGHLERVTRAVGEPAKRRLCA